MKVLIIGPSYPFRGGIAHFSGCLYRELKLQKHEPTLINLRNQYPKLFFPGKSQYETESFFSDLSSYRILTPYNPITYKRTYKGILSYNPDVVIFNFFIPFQAPSFIYLVRKLNQQKIRTLIITHNIDFHEKWFCANLLTNILLRKSWKIVSLSQSVHEDIVHQKPELKTKAHVLFHPLYDFYNQNRYTTTDAKARLGVNGRKVILFYGYIKPYKGLDILLRSFSMIKKALPEAFLLIAGEIYGDKSGYYNLIKSSGFKEDIQLTEQYVDNKLTELYFKAADLLATPYRQATQRGVVQIAYSMDIGVVVTPVGGLPEMVIHGKTGIVSKSTHPEDFSEAVVSYFNLDRTSVTSYIKDYKKSLSWKRFTEDLLTLI